MAKLGLFYNDNLRLFVRRAAVLPLVLSELVEGLWFNALEDSEDVATNNTATT